jgi:hypothetical protein
MTPQQFQRVAAVFAMARAAGVGERAALLDRECAGDSALRAEVESLLARDGSTEDWATAPPVPTAPPTGGGAPTIDDRLRASPMAMRPPEVEGYRIIGPLGEGGMGTVWRAMQLGTRREVALKLMGRATLGSRRAHARFEREVELAATLEHPHIARVYDAALHEGVYHYAMELVEGGVPLREFVESRKLTRRQILELVAMVCRAVQHAHQKGIIHRDLKPSNILATPDGAPKLVDFGLARLIGSDDADDAITLSGEISGTPAYMAPEQARGESDKTDTRTDVYALGAILYELLTGHLPHPMTGSLLAVLKRIAEEDVRPPQAVSPDIDHELNAVVLKALSRPPDERYTSAGEMAAELERYLAGEPVLARPHTAWYVLSKWTLRHRWAVAGTAAAALAVAAGVGLYVYNVRQAYHATLQAQIRAEGERQTAVSNARRAGEQRSLALQTLNDLIFHVQRELGRDAAQLALRRRLMDLAIVGLQRLADDARSPDDRADRSVAAALIQVGDIFQLAGHPGRAEEAYRQAVQMFEQLSAERAPQPQARRDLMVGHLRLAWLVLRRRDVASARPHVEAARVIMDSLSSGGTEAADSRERCLLASAMADLRLADGDPRGALPLYGQAAEIAARGLAARRPGFSEQDRSASLKKLGQARVALFDVDGDAEHLRAASRSLATAISIDRAALEPRPTPQARRDLALGLRAAGEVHLRAGADAEARAALEEALGLAESVIASDAERADWRADAAAIHGALSKLLDRAAQPEQAATHRAMAAELLRNPAATRPTSQAQPPISDQDPPQH